MARDVELEALVEESLQSLPGISRKAMFGGAAWMQHGNLLCCASKSGLLARLGKGNETWALEEPGVTGMLSVGRAMPGWVHANRDVSADEQFRTRLLHHAKRFVATLPPKV